MFCGRADAEVPFLLQGMDGYICSDCVRLAAEYLEEIEGKKMAGHMGFERVTVQNLRVVRVDENLQVLMVKGAIPGPAASVVVVKKAVKK